MSERLRVVGSFADEETCVRGIAAVRDAGAEKPRVFSPFASEPILAALQTTGSPVRRWVLAGGITGCASGFALTIGLAVSYPHVTAGMPIVSIPPFVIIAFELTILFGALSGLAGFLVHGRLPRTAPAPGYAPRFSNDRFGVVIQCAAGERGHLETVLRAAGATEVTAAELPLPSGRAEGA
jgi:molybdopterin-containing oxidoreductase family membrane subunit